MWTYNTELYHHGIKGMRWGVRRFQNEDGSYTKRGLDRYRKAENEYNEAKAAYKAGSGSRKEAMYAKKKLSKQYDQLKLDKAADKGRQLYAQGKRIDDLNLRMQKIASVTGIAGSVGAGIVAAALSRRGDDTLSITLKSGAVAAGAAAVGALLSAKPTYERDKLRKYYGHKG